MRHDGRLVNSLRPIKITRKYTAYAEGSVLVCFGNTQVLCNASITEGVPRFLKGSKQGWITAEYAMLPRATHERRERDSALRPNGRSLEIQRLIGRALRSMVNMAALGENTIVIDCDVLQADGGTRTAAITGAAVALCDALNALSRKLKLTGNPIKHMVASVSVGMVDGCALLDLNYQEDSKAETDMNIVMNDRGEFIELQGTAENQAFNHEQLQQMLTLGREGISELLQRQQEALQAD